MTVSTTRAPRPRPRRRRTSALTRQLGGILRAARLTRGWTWSDVERHGGPTYQTVATIEQGRAATLDALAKHCEALEFTLEDVLRRALVPVPYPIEVQQIARIYAGASPLAQEALRTMARAIGERTSKE